MKKILITGGEGQLAYDLNNTLEYPKLSLISLNKKELDITDKMKLVKVVKNISPDLIINTAAYTKVDDAESNKKIAINTNSLAPKNIAYLCNELDIPLIHISTDYVFDGKKPSMYYENDTPNPINYYGFSKLEGEKYIRSLLKKYIIIRAGWLFGFKGNNFVKTILKISKNKEIRIVDDQFGVPTPTDLFAKDVLHISNYLLNNEEDNLYGTYHYTCKPSTSWHNFAEYIINSSYKKGLINNKPKVIPIKTTQYNFIASRPKNTILNSDKINKNFNVISSEWKIYLNKLIDKLKNEK